MLYFTSCPIGILNIGLAATFLSSIRTYSNIRSFDLELFDMTNEQFVQPYPWRLSLLRPYPRSPGSSSEEQRSASGGCSGRWCCLRDESMSGLRPGRSRGGGALRCARRSTDNRAETCCRRTWLESSPARYPLPWWRQVALAWGLCPGMGPTCMVD